MVHICLRRERLFATLIAISLLFSPIPASAQRFLQSWKDLALDPESAGLSVGSPRIDWETLGENRLRIGGLNLTLEVGRVQWQPGPAGKGRFSYQENSNREGLDSLWVYLGEKRQIRLETRTSEGLWLSEMISRPRDISEARFCRVRTDVISCGPQLAQLGRGAAGQASRGPILLRLLTDDGSTSLADEGSVISDVGGRSRILAEDRFGARLIVSLKPPGFAVREFERLPNGRVRLSGIGQPPDGSRPFRIREAFDPTRIQEKEGWELRLTDENQNITVQGESGLRFRYLLESGNPPPIGAAPQIDSDFWDGTYDSEWSAPIRAPAEYTLQALEGRIEAGRWTVPLGVRGLPTNARVQLSKGDQSWTFRHDIFRGFLLEASARSSALVGREGAMPLFEASAVSWFESIGGWRNRWLSHQRWGLTARYQQSLGAARLAPELSVSEFRLFGVELRYNFWPGVWNRSELVGLILAHQAVRINESGRQMQGLGLYWARMMPEVFASAMEMLPWFRYPKFVDMDGTWFVQTGEPLGAINLSLNFHGKVFWRPGFYGELGLGIRRVDFTDTLRRQTVLVQSGYITMGLGLTI